MTGRQKGNDGPEKGRAPVNIALSACDRIGPKKTKRRFPLARVEGTIFQFF
jgi:hypothetical protein